MPAAMSDISAIRRIFVCRFSVAMCHVTLACMSSVLMKLSTNEVNWYNCYYNKILSYRKFSHTLIILLW